MSKDVILFNITWLDGKAVKAKPVKLKAAAAKNVIAQIDPNNRNPEWCTKDDLASYRLEVEVIDEKQAKKTGSAPAATVTTPPVTTPPPATKPAIKSVEETEKQ